MHDLLEPKTRQRRFARPGRPARPGLFGVAAMAVGAWLALSLLLAASGWSPAPYFVVVDPAGVERLEGVTIPSQAWQAGVRDGMPVTRVAQAPYAPRPGGTTIQVRLADRLFELPANLPAPNPWPAIVGAGLLLAALVLRPAIPSAAWILTALALVWSADSIAGAWVDPLATIVWSAPVWIAMLYQQRTFRGWHRRPFYAEVAAWSATVTVLAVITTGSLPVTLPDNLSMLVPALTLLVVISAVGHVALAAVRRADERIGDLPDISRVTRQRAILDELIPGRSATRIAAAEEERVRLSVAIHDEVLPALVAAVRHLDASDPDEAARLRQALASLRGKISDLRLVALEVLGLPTALEELARIDRGPGAGGVELQIIRPGAPRLPARVETAAYRIARQAVDNAIARGAAERVVISLDVPDVAHGLLTIEDDGCGFDAEHAAAAIRGGHLGLVDMRERTEAVGGLLAIVPILPHGTRVVFRWPA